MNTPFSRATSGHASFLGPGLQTSTLVHVACRYVNLGAELLASSWISKYQNWWYRLALGIVARFSSPGFILVRSEVSSRRQLKSGTPGFLEACHSGKQSEATSVLKRLRCFVGLWAVYQGGFLSNRSRVDANRELPS